MRFRSLAGAPAELEVAEQQPLLLVLRVAHDRLQQPSVSFARTRFRRLLTALRLFEKGGYAIGPIGYSRIDDGVWSPLPLGSSGRPRLMTLIPRETEDELRAFCNLISRRVGSHSPGGRGPDNSGAGEAGWALARFEMGRERVTPFEALTDYLLALRAARAGGPGQWQAGAAPVDDLRRAGAASRACRAHRTRDPHSSAVIAGACSRRHRGGHAGR